MNNDLFKKKIVPQLNFPRTPDPITPEVIVKRDGTRVLSKKALKEIKQRLEQDLPS